MRANTPTLLTVLTTIFAARALFLAATELDSTYYLSFARFLVAGAFLLGFASFLTKQREPRRIRTVTIVLATMSTAFFGFTALSLEVVAGSASGTVRWLAIITQMVSGTVGCGFGILAVGSAWANGFRRQRSR